MAYVNFGGPRQPQIKKVIKFKLGVDNIKICLIIGGFIVIFLYIKILAIIFRVRSGWVKNDHFF